MKILDILSDFFGLRRNAAPSPAPASLPAPNPKPTVAPPPVAKPVAARIRAATQLMADKAANQLAFIDRTWNLRLWRDAAHFADWKHDIAVMREYHDLSAVSLEAIGHDERVLFREKITFTGGARNTAYDTVGGVELPLLDRAAIKSARLLVYRRDNPAALHLLKLPWEDAAELPVQPGDVIASDHAAKITGGRQKGELHVAATARHRIEVTQTGTRDYAFARDLDRPITGIFLHKKFTPPGFAFSIGQKLTAILVAGPKGIQARSIRFGN